MFLCIFTENIQYYFECKYKKGWPNMTVRIVYLHLQVEHDFTFRAWKFFKSASGGTCQTRRRPKHIGAKSYENVTKKKNLHYCCGEKVKINLFLVVFFLFRVKIITLRKLIFVFSATSPATRNAHHIFTHLI